MSVITFRIDETFRNRLDSLCKLMGKNVSEVVKEAVNEYALEREKLSGRKTEELSDFQRLLLHHLLKLRHTNEPLNADIKSEIEIIESGWEGEYHSLFLNREFVSAETTREVREILKMYVELKIGFLQSTEKRGLTFQDIEFRGFDHEGEELSYQNFANYLLNVRGSYSQLRNDDGHVNFKSDHISNLNLYRKMLPIWRRCRELNFVQRVYELNIDQVHEIVSALTWNRLIN